MIDWRSVRDYHEGMADHQDNDRRNEFIAAAEKLFRENGIVDTTISSIVKEVNVAKGLFYYYFNSKEDVIDAVSEKYREIFRAHVQQKAEEQDYDERLAHFVENVTASFTELWNNVGGKDMSPLSQKSVDDAKKDASEMLKDLLDEGVRLNRLVIRNTQYFAQLIVNGIAGLLGQDGMDEEEIRRIVDDILNTSKRSGE